MTDSGALLVALALIVNELSIVYKANLLAEDYFPSNLVFLLSICLLLEKIRVISLLHLYTPLGFLLEILLSTALLECALVHIWRPIQFYLLLNADDILVQLYEDETFNWLVCPLCCGNRNPSPDFVRLWNIHLLATPTQTVAGAAGVGLIARDYNFPRLRWRVAFSPLSYFIVNERGRMQRNRIERTSSKRWRGSVRRIIASSVYNLSCFTHGCSTGWVSGVLGNEALTGGAWLAALPCLVALPAAPMFAVLADVKGRKAGALCIGLSFIVSIDAKQFSWSLAAWCGARGIWAARVAAGAGGAGALALAPLYCAEIAPRTRGLAAMPALASSCGILFAYSAGGILSAHALSLLMAIPSVLLLISLLWLPETPSFLINTGKIQEAAKVMCWFDGSDFREDLTDVIEQQEVRIRTSDSYGRRDVVSYNSDTFQPMIKRNSGLESPDKRRQKNEKSACRELFLHRRARRALVSCFVVIGAAAGSGAGAVNSFAAAVLRHSAHQIPVLNTTAYNLSIYNGTLPRNLFETSEAGSMLCGTALVLGAAVATFTVDKVGRKTLLLWSCSGIAFCLAILGIYCDPHLQMHSSYKHRFLSNKKFAKDKSIREKIDFPENLTLFNDSFKFSNDTKPWYRVSSENFNTTDEEMLWSVKFEHNVEQEEFKIWLPVVLLSMVLFLYNIGLGSVPYVLISELFFVNVRSLASSFLITWMWLSNFFVLRYYGTIAFSIGLHATYYICSSITLLGAGYIYLTLPETKGKSQSQIDESLDGPWLLTSERKNGR